MPVVAHWWVWAGPDRGSRNKHKEAHTDQAGRAGRTVGLTVLSPSTPHKETAAHGQTHRHGMIRTPWGILATPTTQPKKLTENSMAATRTHLT